MLIALGYDHRGRNMARLLMTEVFWPSETNEDSSIIDIRQALFQKENGEKSFSGTLFDERNGESDIHAFTDNHWEGAFLISGDLISAKFVGKKITFLESPKYLLVPSETKNGNPQNPALIHIDYPDVAAAVAEKVCHGEVDYGILIDGTGIGMSVVANKFQGVRAAVCFNQTSAELSRRHNNANVLCLPGEMLGKMSIAAMVTCWLNTPYEGQRHQRRLDKITLIEQKTGL